MSLGPGDPGASAGEAAGRTVAPDPPAHRPRLRRLVLSDFRSYAALDLPLSGRTVVLTGENGAGKTNLLEAISLLTPGRGLRRAEAGELARIGGAGGWAVSATVEAGAAGGPVQLGTGAEPAEGGLARRYRLDRAPVPSARAFADIVRVVWLTPAMDSLFTGPASERRRFLDRIVVTLDAEHGTRVTGLDRALRNRNRLLEDGRTGGRVDRAWLDAAEREVAGLGVAVAAAREETVTRLSALVAAARDDASPFPWAALRLEGTVESLLAEGPALAAEERYRDLLGAARGRDAAAGRTTIGPHLTDLAVEHGPKGAPADRCSTGEQKALLVGLVLAQARLVAALSGIAPFVLLDEIAAHFDPRRRAALFEALARLGGHVVMTGADPAAFADAGPVERFEVAGGRLLAVGGHIPSRS